MMMRIECIVKYQWGNANYTLAGIMAQTSKDLNNVTIGNYSITITDQMNCKDSFSFILQQPDSLAINDFNPNFYSQDNGTLSSNASGGTAPYSMFEHWICNHKPCPWPIFCHHNRLKFMSNN